MYARPIAYNVIPLCEVPDPSGSGFTTEETKMAGEARKILGLPDLHVAATAVRVPVVVGPRRVGLRASSTATPPWTPRERLWQRLPACG